MMNSIRAIPINVVKGWSEVGSKQWVKNPDICKVVIIEHCFIGLCSHLKTSSSTFGLKLSSCLFGMSLCTEYYLVTEKWSFKPVVWNRLWGMFDQVFLLRENENVCIGYCAHIIQKVVYQKWTTKTVYYFFIMLFRLYDYYYK